jgi:hypothetical protein
MVGHVTGIGVGRSVTSRRGYSFLFVSSSFLTYHMHSWSFMLWGKTHVKILSGNSNATLRCITGQIDIYDRHITAEFEE